jgi:hypothetical protein
MKRLSILLIICLFLSCRLITEPQELTIIREIIELAWIKGYNDSNQRTLWYIPGHDDSPGSSLVRVSCDKIELYLLDSFFVYQNDNISHRYPIEGTGWSWKKL